jgi:hypothetical protein
MKKPILALLAIFCALHVDAQVLGTPLYNWDFSTGFPAGFELGSSTPLATWEYRGPATVPNNTVCSRGSCGAGTVPPASTTLSNGFVIFDSNYWDNATNPCSGTFFGTGVDPAPHTAWFITEPIDLSGASGAVLTFQQQLRLFQGNTKVQISIDGGLTWTDILTNSVFVSPNVEWQSVNISTTIAGQTDVRFRFQFSGRYYHWAIDDITVYRPSINDVLLSESKYTQYGNPVLEAFEEMEYDQYPTIMRPPLTFTSRTTNIGSNLQNDVRLNVGVFNSSNTQILNVTSGLVDMNPGQTSTFTAGLPYTPPATVGDYRISYTMSQTEEDETPQNNTDTLDFSVSAFTYARDEGPAEDVFVPAATFQNQRLEIGNVFQPRITGLQFPSISVAVGPGTQPGTVIQGFVYDGNKDTLFATTAPYTVNVADINALGEEKLITLYLEQPMTLIQDSMLMVMVGNVNASQPLRVCRAGASPEFTSFVEYPDVNGFFYLLRTPVVRMNIFPATAIAGCTNSAAINFNPLATTTDGSCDFAGCTIIGSDNYNPAANFDDGSCILSGCTDPEAFNYQPFATSDDGSCIYAGCTSPEASNYNPIATVEDGSCIFLGCTNPNAENFNPTANQDDGSCIVIGCTNPLASNFDPEANVSDNSCIFLGCTNPSAENFDPMANEDDGTCIILGCTEAEADNFNPDATIDDGSCIYFGCTNPIAQNYDPQANTDDGSCLIPGCTNPQAENFDPIATVNDGSCIVFGCTNADADNYNPDATIDDESCIFIGCTDASASNYDPTALEDDGSCLYLGCTQPDATNFDPTANSDDGSCVFAFANFSANLLEGCAPLTVVFSNLTDLSLGGSCSFTADNGFQLSSCENSFEITFEEAGEFMVNYNFEINGTSTSFAVGPITVFAAPATPILTAQPGLVSCSNCDNQNAVWTLDNVVLGGIDNNSFVSTIDGIYQNGNYAVEVSSPNGCTSQATIFALFPQVLLSATEGCEDLSVQATNLTDAVTGMNCELDFGDGTVVSANQSPINHTYTTAAPYSLLLTCASANGQGEVQQQVTVFAEPAAIFTQNGDGLNEVECVGCSGNTSIEWFISDYFGSDVTLTDVNSFISDGNDSGTLTVTNEFGCSRVFDFTFTQVDEMESKSWKIAPNPVSDSFTILHPQRADEITVLSTDGKVIYKNSLPSINPTIDCSQWPSGVYFVQWHAANNFGTKKVVVAH